MSVLTESEGLEASVLWQSDWLRGWHSMKFLIHCTLSFIKIPEGQRGSPTADVH